MAILIKEILLLTAIVSVLGLQQMCHCKDGDLPVSLLKLHKLDELALAQAEQMIPVIIWHGLGDTAYNSFIIGKFIEKEYKGTSVFSILIGKGEDEDEQAAIWGNLNSQIDKACQAIISNEIIQTRKMINFLGFSQGALFLRGLIERCPFEEHSIKVHNFVSIGGPQQGVYGVPEDPSRGKMSHYMMKNGVSMLAYWSYFQKNCIPANYWHNPNDDAKYRKKTFLADINNEGSTFHQEYRDRFKSINKLVLVKFNRDMMIKPIESMHFGFYAKGSTKVVELMSDTKLYKEDLIGLKFLNENNRIDFLQLNTEHLDFSKDWFRDNIVKVYFTSK